MTIDEAKDYIREWCPYDRQEEIIKALEQKPCDKCVYSTNEGCQYDDITEIIPPFDDCISRQAVLDAINTDWHEDLSQLTDAIKALPPVTQEPKTGHWILKRTFPTKLYDEYLNEYKCSECYREIRCTESQLVNYPYCHCGSKMQEPRENEKINCKTTKCENCQNHNYCDYEPRESEEKPKSECERDHEILKAYSDGANDVLDKIRTEIDAARFLDKDKKLFKNANASGLEVAMDIIDKYMAEGSDKE